MESEHDGVSSDAATRVHQSSTSQDSGGGDGLPTFAVKGEELKSFHQLYRFHEKQMMKEDSLRKLATGETSETVAGELTPEVQVISNPKTKNTTERTSNPQPEPSYLPPPRETLTFVPEPTHLDTLPGAGKEDAENNPEVQEIIIPQAKQYSNKKQSGSSLESPEMKTGDAVVKEASVVQEIDLDDLEDELSDCHNSVRKVSSSEEQILASATDSTTTNTVGGGSSSSGIPSNGTDHPEELDPIDSSAGEREELEYVKMRQRRQSSILAEQADPFTKREGKTLTWTNVNMTLKRGKEPGRKILDNVWGSVPREQTTAIMGPSGASKSTLLEVLAGRIASSASITVDADVRLDSVPVSPRKMKCAFVAQDDSLLSTATPRESIYFSAKLRLPRSTCEGQLRRLTDRVLLELGLEACADTLVGGPLVKGISGGERRRTSIGVELVVKPTVICLDEPTSGLDSFSAIKVFHVLQKVANAGASVVFSIHQPSSELFNGIDHLILMNKGRVVYQGSVGELPSHFAKCGHEIPPRYNPADWILTVCHSTPAEVLMSQGFYPTDEREQVEPTHDASMRSSSGRKLLPLDTRPPGKGVQLQLLFKREARNLWRNYIAVGARLLFTIVGSLLVGAIMLGIGREDRDEVSNTQSQFGALIIVLLSSMVMTALPALLAFPEERPVFLREYATKHYSVVSYFLAHFTMEMVLTGLQTLIMCAITYAMIGFQSNFFTYFVTVYALAITSAAMAVLLGCGIEDPMLAQEMLPVLFIPQMLFAGFFVAPHLIPVWLRWIRYLCSLTFAVRILLVSEFNRDCGSAFADGLCDYVLETADADPDEVWWNWLLLVALLIAFRLTALLILKKKATKYF